MSIILENEKILVEVRKHHFYFFSRLIEIVFLGVIIPVGLYVWVASLVPTFYVVSILAFFLFVYSIILIFIWIYIFIFWTDHFLDAWIITDTRVIDFELKGLFNKDISSVKLENIQDIKVTVNGVFNHWLKSGNIYLQTAGAEKEFFIQGVKNPDQAKAKIFAAINARALNNTDQAEKEVVTTQVV